tara:strand:+ start:42365 stop:43360 length:996 start_codon:yes stop_codon:yes gene_type:complete
VTQHPETTATNHTYQAGNPAGAAPDNSQTGVNKQPGPAFLVTAMLLLLPPLFWAGNFIVGRAVRNEIPPVTLSVSRWIIASIILLPFAWRAVRRDYPLYWQHRWLILGISLTGITAFNSLIYLGLQTTQAANGIILNSFIPLLIVLLGGCFLGYAVRRVQIAGMVISFAGVLAIVMRGDLQRLASLNVAHGDLILLSAMLCWAFYTLGLKAVPAAINRTGLLSVQMATGLIFLLPFWGWELASGQRPVWNFHSLLSLAYVGVVPSVLAYLLYNACVARLGPARAGLSIHLIPLFGALLSVLYLGEQIHLYHLLGAVLIFTGIVIASRSTGQ